MNGNAAVANVNGDEVVVEARAHTEASAGAQTLDSVEGEHVAGSQGDAVKSALSLPGLARSAFDSGDLVVWGSSADETRIYVDGVEIPMLFHGSAIRSVLPNELVQSVSLVPGGYGAEYGRGLGGIVRVKTKPLSVEGVHGTIAADTLDARAVAIASLGEGITVAIAGRYGYFDRLLPRLTSRDVSDYLVIPRYGDWQAKATFTLRAREELSLVILGARDDLRRALPSANPSAVRAETTTRDFSRIYLRYTHTLDDGAEIEATPFFGLDRDLQAASFGDVPTDVESRSLRYGMRARYREELSSTAGFMLGFDALGSRARLERRGSLTIPGREGDLTYFGRPPGDDLAADDFTTHILDLAPWAEGRIDLGPLTLTPGLRLETMLVETSRITPRVGRTPEIGDARASASLDPRIAIALHASRKLTLGAAFGRHHQPPAPQDLSAVFGTPTLTWSSATHATASATLKPVEGITIDLVGFYKHLSNLPVRTRAIAPRLAYELVQDGEGRAYGIELIVRKKLAKGLFGFISYTFSRSERRYLGDPSYRLFDFDQPRALSLVASQTLDDWTFGFRFRYTSGLPRTPIVSGYQDLRDDRTEPIFGAQNSTRLPSFYALDLRIERAFSLSQSTRMILSLDVMNATFHKNAEEIAYAQDLRSHAYITGLPTLAVVGARLEF